MLNWTPHIGPYESLEKCAGIIIGNITAANTPASAPGGANANKRSGRDSNPRYGYPHTAFPVRLLQPLGHRSNLS